MKDVSNLILDLEKDKQVIIIDFISSLNFLSWNVFKTEDQLQKAFYNYTFLYNKNINKSNINFEEFLSIYFNNINAILREDWNYEQNGLFTVEKEAFYSSLIKQFENMIIKSPTIGFNFFTYKGLNISYFYKCGVKSLEELINLKGSFLKDEGFINSSLLVNDKYIRDNYQIKLEIMVNGNYNDGLVFNNTYLINAESVLYVTDVLINNEYRTATVRGILIPNDILNRSFTQLVEIRL